MTAPKIVVLPGDSVGPEIIGQSLRVVEWFAAHRGFNCDLRIEPYGADSYRKTGVWLGENVLADMLSADAVLFGSIGSGPEFEKIPVELRRRFGMPRIRREMGLFANLRPIRSFPSVADASPLRAEVTKGVDILFVREIAGGIYQQGPRGIETLPDGQRRGFNTQVYTTSEIRRIACVAFELARRRRRSVTSIDKANAMESGALWREEVQTLQGSNYPDIELRHSYVDNAAFELAQSPRNFDVVLADNMFGDILSDGAAIIAGSPGMLPSASLGEMDAAGRRRAMYEPLHGGAPDTAGRNIANPIGAILCFALALENSFHRPDDAKLLHLAVDNALAAGVRPFELASTGNGGASTEQIGTAVLQELARLAGN